MGIPIAVSLSILFTLRLVYQDVLLKILIYFLIWVGNFSKKHYLIYNQ